MFLNDVDLSKIPWRELIRARTVDEFRQVVVRLVGAVAATLGAENARETIGHAAARSAATRTEVAGRKDAGSAAIDGEVRLAGLIAAADIDEICPPYPFPFPFPFPFPRPWPWPWPIGPGGPLGPEGPWGPDGPWGPWGPGGPVEARERLTAREVQLVARVMKLAQVAEIPEVVEATRSVLESAR